MGILPLGKASQEAKPLIAGGVGEPLGGDATATLHVQSAFMIGGSLIGILGVILPHPAPFLVPQLLVLNALGIVTALVTWAFASRISFSVARLLPVVGTTAISAAVIFSRDATSAYAMLYIFPGVYAYYFLGKRDAAFHILFAALNYALVIALLPSLSGNAELPAGSVVHHFVITVGMMVTVGAMLVYLRQRVEGLMQNIVAAARTDLATGLLNARGLQEVLAAELDRARMGSHRVAMLSISLSGTRDLGGRLGHQAVEAVVEEAGRLFDDSTRRMDSVARVGPSDFAIVLPETDESTAYLLAEQILARVRRTFRERKLPISACIGIAAFPKHAVSGDGLTQASRSAAEAAGELGGDRAVVFSEELEDVLGDEPARKLTEGRAHLSTVLSLAEVLDLRDARTATHSLAVARYAEMLGRELGLPEQRVQRLRLAGLLHDIGKVGIPDQILEKPGPLSPEEWDQVRRHPEMAARILGARELTDIREWVLARHEQPDGHGYPRGLSGDAIPLEARILAVAEAFDAMTNDRPYRPAMSRSEALEELGRYAGSQFDGEVVDAFVRALQQAEPEPVGG